MNETEKRLREEHRPDQEPAPGRFNYSARCADQNCGEAFGYYPCPTAQALELLDAERATYSWRPIETAPKDGTWILLRNSSWIRERVLGFWDAEELDWCVESSGPPYVEPEQWCPIPPLPEETKE